MPKFHICAIPQSLWSTAGVTEEKDLLRDFLDESQLLWRRIHKGVNAEAERARYLVTCGGVDSIVGERASPISDNLDQQNFISLLDSGKFPALELGADYFDFLAHIHLLECEAAEQHKQTTAEVESLRIPLPGLGATIIPPENLGAHIQEVDLLLKGDNLPSETLQGELRRRQRFLKEYLMPNGCGLVEVQEPLENQNDSTPLPRPTQARPTIPPSAATPDWTEETISGSGRDKMAARLSSEIEIALSSAGKVNLSNQPHEVTTEVLSGIVRRPQDYIGTARQVRVVYADGSEARTFPLHCVPAEKSRAPESGAVLRACLMSMRHIDLDLEVDMAWFRNIEVSQTRALSDSDDFCFEDSLKRFKELYEVYKGEHLTLQMYHTGFEPASVGFYRALTVVLAGLDGWGADWASSGENWIQVIPSYFRGEKGYEQSNQPWN